MTWAESKACIALHQQGRVTASSSEESVSNCGETGSLVYQFPQISSRGFFDFKTVYLRLLDFINKINNNKNNNKELG